MDNKHKFIDTYHTTSASVHDSQVLDELLDEEKDKGKDLWADSAYTGEEQDKTIEKYQMNITVYTRKVQGGIHLLKNKRTIIRKNQRQGQGWSMFLGSLKVA